MDNIIMQYIYNMIFYGCMNFVNYVVSKYILDKH